MCAAPKGIPLRNTFIQAIWETHSIELAVPKERAAFLRNSGSRNVPLPIHRDTRLPRLRGARARSIAAITQDWGETGDHWGAPGMDVDQVAATRSTLTPLRGSGIGYDGEPVEVPLDGTRRWRIDSKHPKWDTSRPETFRRQPKQFERDSRFGPDWSHVSHDGTLRIGS